MIRAGQMGSAKEGFKQFLIRQEKEPKPKLSGPDIFEWGGGPPREGVGAKKFVRYVLRSPVRPNIWAGYTGIFAGISQGRMKS